MKYPKQMRTEAYGHQIISCLNLVSISENLDSFHQLSAVLVKSQVTTPKGFQIGQGRTRQLLSNQS